MYVKYTADRECNATTKYNYVRIRKHLHVQYWQSADYQLSDVFCM